MGVMRTRRGTSGRDARKTTNMFVPFAVGFIATATVVTAFMTAVGQAVAPNGAATFVVVVGLGVLATLEVTRVRRSLLDRQTPQGLPRAFGPYFGGLAWGLDTGSMFSTVRTTFGTHAIFWLCLTGVATDWSGMVYGLGFCAPLAISLYGPLLVGRSAFARLGSVETIRYVEKLSVHVRQFQIALCGLMIVVIVTITTAAS